ncbi:MAG: SLATT domain-containing protein [Fibrobacter sp.]|nr:SLATT domain-containing protein [Fibrobacter sp.]
MGTNLTPDNFPYPDKYDDVCEEIYLEKVRLYVINEAQKAITWYMVKKEFYKRWSRLIRILTIVFFTIGAIAPLIAALQFFISKATVDITQYGYIALAIAGSLLLLDRCFGFTTAWVRFITAATNIQKLITKFDSKYLLLCHDKHERCKNQLECIRNFITDVREEIVKESAAWVIEYSSNLSRLEEMVSKKVS